MTLHTSKRQHPIDRVNGVAVYSSDQLVPQDNRAVNPLPWIPHYEHIRRQEWNMLQRAHWQTCQCPICGERVSLVDWYLHLYFHPVELYKISRFIQALFSMF